jgi:predicted Zn-dependent protease with MMP-like domain
LAPNHEATIGPVDGYGEEVAERGMIAPMKDQKPSWAESPAPSLVDFLTLAQAAFDALPEEFRALAGEVELRVQDFADDALLDEMGIDNAFELTGLYDGVDLSRRSVFEAAPPSRVFLYRRPILDEWAERGDVSLEFLVTHVLVHEIGHHFGLSDEQIEAVEASD